MAAFYTLLYIADPADAEAVGCAEDAADRWPSVWLKHIGDLELVQLWSAVADLPPKSGTLMDDLVFQGGEEGPFVMRVPPAFVAALARVPEDHVPAIAAAWGRSEELADWQPEDLSGVVGELRAFCRGRWHVGRPCYRLLTFRRTPNQPLHLTAAAFTRYPGSTCTCRRGR